MNLGLRNQMSVNVTVVSNDFIDTYMTAANGEYVKVFLYLLRHEREELTVSDIADALNHTESDVKRALAYWKDAGVLGEEAAREPIDEKAAYEKAAYEKAAYERAAYEKAAFEKAVYENAEGAAKSRVTAESLAAAEQMATAEQSRMTAIPESGNSFERMQKLSEDEEFAALLYAVQQYMGKTFTQIECEKFAFFYDGLRMSADLLEYLAEYCAGGGHTSIRYIEKVALNWYQMGIKTREDAKDYTMRYSRDMSSVMKAFGITNRNPATAELEFMKKWFKEYGFDSTLVTEACSRTITATGAASFPYTDKILAGWKENGVKTLSDVQELDKRRQMAKGQSGRGGETRQTGRESGRGIETGRGQTTGVQGRRTSGTGNNRFKNFEERSYDYEDMVWSGVRKRQKGGTVDGTQ